MNTHIKSLAAFLSLTTVISSGYASNPVLYQEDIDRAIAASLEEQHIEEQKQFLNLYANEKQEEKKANIMINPEDLSASVMFDISNSNGQEQRFEFYSSNKNSHNNNLEGDNKDLDEALALSLLDNNELALQQEILSMYSKNEKEPVLNNTNNKTSEEINTNKQQAVQEAKDPFLGNYQDLSASVIADANNPELQNLLYNLYTQNKKAPVNNIVEEYNASDEKKSSKLIAKQEEFHVNEHMINTSAQAISKAYKDFCAEKCPELPGLEAELETAERFDPVSKTNIATQIKRLWKDKVEPHLSEFDNKKSHIVKNALNITDEETKKVMEELDELGI